MTGLAVTDVLDGPLFFLGRDHLGVLDLALLTLTEDKVALVFSDEALAQAHLHALTASVTVQAVRDLRAKEELFRAALARGATTLWLDTPAGGNPQMTYPLQRALDYTLSFKRQSACL